MHKDGMGIAGRGGDIAGVKMPTLDKRGLASKSLAGRATNEKHETTMASKAGPFENDVQQSA